MNDFIRLLLLSVLNILQFTKLREESLHAIFHSASVVVQRLVNAKWEKNWIIRAVDFRRFIIYTFEKEKNEFSLHLCFGLRTIELLIEMLNSSHIKIVASFQFEFIDQNGL